MKVILIAWCLFLINLGVSVFSPGVDVVTMASKLLGVVGIFIMANYAAVHGRCLKPACPPTWSLWRDKCYKVHDADITWEEGKQQ